MGIEPSSHKPSWTTFSAAARDRPARTRPPIKHVRTLQQWLTHEIRL